MGKTHIAPSLSSQSTVRKFSQRPSYSSYLLRLQLMGSISCTSISWSPSLAPSPAASCSNSRTRKPSKNQRHHNKRVHSCDSIRKNIVCSTNGGAGVCKRLDEGCTVQKLPTGMLRREMMCLSTASYLVAFCNLWTDEKAMASDFADMPALRGKDYGKSKMRYPDYTVTESGLQFKDLRQGTGDMPKEGETVVVDWDGYTIGYYGRIFEARNKAKGGSFEGNEKGYLRIRIGTHEVIPAFEEALLTMNLGSVRRIIVPPELGYPDNDFNKKGPRPTTFSGQRALDFVLKNQGLIDKTLLFDIELLKISPS